MNKSDIEKTAITTPFGFQRFINETFAGLDFVFPYLDDALIASENEKEHLEHLRCVFERLREKGLIINVSKCCFGESKVKFLGHVISSEGISPLPEKVEEISCYPLPKDVMGLKRFLAMLNYYRRFLPHAAEIQLPLLKFMKGNKRKDKTLIAWTPESTDAFDKCKNLLANAAILVYPSCEKPLALFVDASDFAVGAVLQQWNEDSWQPISFFLS